MDDYRNTLRRLFEKAPIPFGDPQIQLLEEYVRLLLHWNAKINLISRKDEENVWYSHIVHSLLPLTLVTIPQGISILDLGSGGGLPGIPMAIARPDCRFVLMDSIRKKTAAVEQMVSHLGLSNVSVATARAEEFPRTRSDRFDLVVARAVAPLVDLIRWSRPLVRRRTSGSAQEADGTVPIPSLLAMKGGDLDAEIAQARIKARAGVVTVYPLTADIPDPGLLADKKLLVVPLT